MLGVAPRRIRGSRDCTSCDTCHDCGPWVGRRPSDGDDDRRAEGGGMGASLVARRRADAAVVGGRDRRAGPPRGEHDHGIRARGTAGARPPGRCQPGCAAQARAPVRRLHRDGLLQGVYILLHVLHGEPFLEGWFWYVWYVPIGLSAAAAAFGLGMTRRARSSVSDLVVELGEIEPWHVRVALARTLGDPSLPCARRPPRRPEPGGPWHADRRPDTLHIHAHSGTAWLAPSHSPPSCGVVRRPGRRSPRGRARREPARPRGRSGCRTAARALRARRGPSGRRDTAASTSSR